MNVGDRVICIRSAKPPYPWKAKVYPRKGRYYYISLTNSYGDIRVQEFPSMWYSKDNFKLSPKSIWRHIVL